MNSLNQDSLAAAVNSIIEETPIFDIHTHIYDIPFGSLLLWGIDELLTYHYLVAEVFRQAPLPYEDFWAMSKTDQADYIWQALFIDNSPVSESCRGVLTCLAALGIDVKERDLGKIRDYFKSTTVADYVDTVYKTANVEAVVMTNNPFDDEERPVWEKGVELNPRFKPALRIDNLLVDWENACERLNGWGYAAGKALDTDKDFAEIRRFLNDWSDTMAPLYMAASLPPTFTYPDDSPCGRILTNAVLPVSRERNVPFAMMIGVKKLVNPQLQLAGDSVGKGVIEALENLCVTYPDNKFLITYLARENQHEACIAARKFNNLMLFGCWWYLNNPTIINDMTRVRMETLGLSFIPQHSDARVLDQLLYKWSHSREIIAEVLIDKYSDLLRTGWAVTEEELKRDIKGLFGQTFTDFINR